MKGVALESLPPPPRKLIVSYSKLENLYSLILMHDAVLRCGSAPQTSPPTTTKKSTCISMYSVYHVQVRVYWMCGESWYRQRSLTHHSQFSRLGIQWPTLIYVMFVGSGLIRWVSFSKSCLASVPCTLFLYLPLWSCYQWTCRWTQQQFYRRHMIFRTLRLPPSLSIVRSKTTLHNGSMGQKVSWLVSVLISEVSRLVSVLISEVSRLVRCPD